MALDQTARAVFCKPSLLDGTPLDAFSSSNLRAGFQYVSLVVRQTFRPSSGEANLLNIPAAHVWWHGTGCTLFLRAVLSQRLAGSPLVTIMVEEHESVTAWRQRFAIRYGLSPRESQIFHLAKAGIARKEIARQLDLSPNTVKTYMKPVTLKISDAGHSPTDSESDRFL